MNNEQAYYSIITRERHRRASGACLTVEDWEDSERAEDAARDALRGMHSLGTAGREGLPDQG